MTSSIQLSGQGSTAKLEVMSRFDQDSFRKLILNDHELFRELLDMFCTDWPNLLADIKNAIANGEARKLEQSAHKLKGNIRNFYASHAADMALRLEEAGRRSHMDGLLKTVADLESELRDLESELKEFFATMN